MSAAPLYLIDGSGFIFRAFHALPNLSRADGTPIGAVLGFCNMLLRVLSEQNAQHIAVIFDAGRKTFRNDIYPEYKANRTDPPEDLIPQFALVRDATAAFAVPGIELPGVEADDLIATYARLAAAQGQECIIVSSDKDLLQLLRPGVSLLDPIKNVPMGIEAALAKFGVTPDKVVDVQALAGDSTDNVPGVPGIGVKTAAELINLYGNLENLLQHADEIRQPKRRAALQQHADKARISRQLVVLKDDVPPPRPLAELQGHAPDAPRLLEFLEANGFRALRPRVEAWLKQLGQDAPTHRAKFAGDEPTAVTTAAPACAGEGARRLSAIESPREYLCIRDARTLKDFLAHAYESGRLAIDTETSSLRAVTADLIGFSLATAPGRAAYVPLNHVRGGGEGLFTEPAEGQMDLKEAADILRPVLADPSILKIGHNLKFDMQVLAQHHLAIHSYDDTLLISWCLGAGLNGHGLDELSQRHLGHTKISFDELTGTGKARLPFAQVEIEKAAKYAAEDADDALRLWHVLKPRLREEGRLTLYERHERPLASVVAGMESAGILVDRAQLQKLSCEFGIKLAALEKEIHALAGGSFNVASPKQLGEILFDAMGLPGGAKGKTGAYSTASDVLEPLAEQGHAIAEKVLEWRGFAKLKSTYTDALEKEIDARTGRVHTAYNLVGAVTGRFSSNDPNLQNIPIRNPEGRAIRRAFIAPPNCALISADYSQVELRILAHMADVTGLKEAFAEGLDIHAATAAQVFGARLEDVTPEQRRGAKAINFGIIYGISGFGLARQLGCSPREAQQFIKAYFARYPEIESYMHRTKVQAQERGCVETLFGRRIYLDGIKDKNPARRGYAERQAINAPIQGSAADIIKRAMVRLPDALAAEKLPARLLLQVHDELLVEAEEKAAAPTAACVKKVMADAARLSVPLRVETGIGPNWDEAH